MLSENDLRELAEFNAQAPVLSLYLNTDPSMGNADAHRKRARSMIKDINLPQDLETINRYLDHEHDWSGRGMALFSCASKGFFKTYSLAVPVRSMVHIGDRPSVKILADLLDNYGGYGVVLVDKQGARLFHFHLGTLMEQEGVLGETIKHTKRGGASSVPGRRGGAAGKTQAMEERIDHNMKDAADFAIHFFESKHIRRILIGGTDENIHKFRSYLPKSWQSLVMGSFPMSMNASHTEVLSRAMQLGAEADARRETALIERVTTAAAKAAYAVTGIDETLAAVNTGRVQTLVVAEGFRKVGYRSKENGELAAELPSPGSVDGVYEKVFDVVDQAVNRVVVNGGEVEVIHDTEGIRKLGNIAALLRY
jgi:peptide subunit release factor 1 (eRF1)